MKEFLHIFLMALALNVICNDTPSNSIESSNNTLTLTNVTSKIAVNCLSFESCTDCVSSSLSCNWCLRSHRCVAHADDKCRNDDVVIGTNRLTLNYRNGPTFCPTINADSDGNEIFVEFDVKKSISVKVNVIAQLIVENPLICLFDFGNRATNTSGRLLGDTIYCDDTNFENVSNKTTNIKGNVKILWDDWKALDNPDNIHILIFQCSDHSDRCDSCLNLPEKYGCGWCASDNKCSLRKNCTENREDSLFWFTVSTGLCSNAKIINVSPHQIQRSITKTLELTIDGLPSMTNNLMCAFTTVNNTIHFTNATRTQTGVKCSSLSPTVNSHIPQGKQHFESTLAVQIQNGSIVASIPFTFYDCTAYSSCTECVSSQFSCNWCVTNYRCTHDSNENCRNDILVTGVSRTEPSLQTGPGFCTKITTFYDKNDEILVPFGTRKMIRIKVENIFQFIVQTRFQCQWSIEGKVISTNAQLLVDTIYCDIIEFSYKSHMSNITVPFAVVWGGNKILDNPNNVHALIYKCNGMAADSNSCSALPVKYNCVWCKSSMDCRVNNDCENMN